LNAIYYLNGMEFTLKELLQIGERIFNMKRVYNTKCGITRKDDIIPPRIQLPLDQGVLKGKVVKIDAMLEEYYKFRGWDNNGIPTTQKLTQLGIVLL
jgi:aldehyde:ferredoxin oxidoreductase